MQMWRFLAPSALGFTSRNMWHALIDRATGAPPRALRAMEHVAAHAERQNPQDVLRKLDEFATSVRWMMSIGPEKDKVIAEARAALARDPRVLELGAYAGYSSIYMADVLGPGTSITSVEVNADNVRAARGNIAHAGLDGRVEVVHGSSSDVIPTLEGSFDLVFLDHWKDLYLKDLQLMETHGLIAPGSVVVADNVGELFGADAYLDYVRHCGRYDSANRPATIEYTSLPDAVEISVYRGQGDDG
jgi:catechol O-methyltransferase